MAAPERQVARSTLDSIAWVSFGWLGGAMLMIALYFVWRWRLRKHRQSLYIASLTLGWIVAGALVVGLPRVIGIAFLLSGALFGTVFVLVLFDELRRLAQERP